MRHPLRLTVFLGLLLTSFSTFAQFGDLFAPYDCRKHAEMFYDTPVEVDVEIDSAAIYTDVEEMMEVDTVNGWREWTFVQNFAFGKDRGNMPAITDLDALHPVFRDKIRQLIIDCHKQGINLNVVESYRTVAKQNEYKGMGRGYTNSKGGRSKHQYGLACDLVPFVDSVAMWDNKALWKKIGETGEKLGLRWGGRWRKPYDPGHFEWSPGVSAQNLSNGISPVEHGQHEHYPCLEEDLRILRKYWKEWETAQSSFTRK